MDEAENVKNEVENARKLVPLLRLDDGDNLEVLIPKDWWWVEVERYDMLSKRTWSEYTIHGLSLVSGPNAGNHVNIQGGQGLQRRLEFIDHVHGLPRAIKLARVGSGQDTKYTAELIA